MRSNKIRFFLFILFIGLIISLWCSLLFGGGKVSFSDMISGISSKSKVLEIIFWRIRIPRTLLSILVGAGLATSGCVFQAILRNPLAEPYTLGVSGGAALGVSIGSILGLGALGLSMVAFLGALISVSLIYFIATKKLFSVNTLILTGVILSFVFSALVMLVFAVCKTEKIHTTLLWLMGDLSFADFKIIRIVGIFIGLGIAILMLFAREIDILLLGEEKAVHLGINSARMVKLLFVISSLIAGACVASGGIIGFVGLIIPHFVRNFTGPRHFVLIPASAISGSIFLCLADTVSRRIIYPLELPVGVITGILGGIILFFFILKSKEWIVF